MVSDEADYRCHELQKGNVAFLEKVSDLLHLDKCQSRLLRLWLIAAKSVMLLGPAASIRQALGDLYSVVSTTETLCLGPD